MEWSEAGSVKGKGKGKGKSSSRLQVNEQGANQGIAQPSSNRAFNTEETDIITKPLEAMQFESKYPLDTKDLSKLHLADSEELDPIDLSNSTSSQSKAVRYSVIVCSKSNPKSSTFLKESNKGIDNAKKVLFAAQEHVGEAAQHLWKCWRWNREIDSGKIESPIKYEKLRHECEQNCLESHSGEGERLRLCRKRLLVMPRFTLTKKFCNEVENASNRLSDDQESYPPDLDRWLQIYDTWSSSERNVALDSLINRSTIMQVRHMMKTIEPLFQTDFISLLPKELALVILGYLEPEDLSKVAQTCRYWKFLANDNLLWKKLCYRAGITSIRPTVFNVPSMSQWKWAYANQHMIESNWRTKPSAEAITMKGHDDHVITCLQCYGNKIVSGSDDTTLKVWSTITGECLQTLTGHAGGVWSCQMIDETIVSGSTDRTLRVWNAVTGRCTSVLGGHTSTVRCMRLYKNKVVSGSRDATLRVWLLPQGRCLQVLTGHMAAVRCVQYDGNLVVSGAYDFCVKVWNPDTGECLHTLTGHTNRVYTLKFDGVHIVSGSLDTSIRVWEAATGQLKHTLLGHTSLITSMELRDNILVSGNADSTLKVWDIASGQCLHTLAGAKKHQLSVTYVQLLKRFVVSSSDDGTVKLWDLKTGEFIRNIVQLASGGAGGNVLRIRATNTQLVCAVGSRNGTEETKLMLMKFDRQNQCQSCNVYLEH